MCVKHRKHLEKGLVFAISFSVYFMTLNLHVFLK